MDRTDTPDPRMRARACLGLELPAGAAGLEALLPALEAAIRGDGPALALLPASGSPQYRAKLRAAVQPGRPVPSEVAVVAATSGSTGNPAGVLLPGSALRAAALGFANRTGRPGGHRWVAALPLHHAGGLMVAVRSVVAGTKPVALASIGGAQPFTVDTFAQATDRARSLGAADGRPLAVSLIPSMLALLDAAGTTGLDLLAAYDVVLVGGAAAPRELVDRLVGAGVRVLTSYGMTETSGGAVFDARPLPGVRVHTGPGGRLVIAGEQVALGYRDGREPARWSIGPDGLRCFRTDDLGQVAADGLVTLAGRADDVVQVGGASVSLGAVREVLMGDPHVGAAELVALPDPRWGHRLVALIVPAGLPDPTNTHTLGAGRDDVGRDPLGLEPLGDLVEVALGRAARPRAVRTIPALPMLESGKVDRQALLAVALEFDGPTR